MDRYVVRRKRKPVASHQVDISSREGSEVYPKEKCEVTDYENNISKNNSLEPKAKSPRLSPTLSSPGPGTVLTALIKHDNKTESSSDFTSVSQAVTGAPLTTATELVSLRKILAENLDCDYGLLYSKREAVDLLELCEKQFEYNTGRLAEVQVFGKWYKIPRKQVAFGDRGLTYTFSGKTVPARPWIPLLQSIRQRISDVTGQTFNFVLINRYKDGSDHIGEHRDDEKDLMHGSPIASVTLGQHRDFVFKHCDARGKNAKRKISPVVVELEHGSLLMMNYPTNMYWYHSLPVRKKAPGVRINMTFRQMVSPKK